MRLTDAIANVHAAERDLTVVRTSPASIGIDAGTLAVGADAFSLPPAARRRFLEVGGAATAYLRRMGETFEVHALSTHLARGDFGGAVAISVRDGEVVGISRGDLTHLAAGEVLTAVEEGLGQAAGSLSVTRIEDSGDRLVLEMTSRAKCLDVRPGDTIEGGLQVLHDRFGSEPTVINGFTLRLVCRNGAIVRQCAANGAIARTRKLPVNHPNARELQLDQVRRLAAQTWDALQPRLAEMQSTQHRAVDIESVFDRWLSRARMSRSLRARLMAAWHEEGGEATQYGAVNAITRVATHDQTLSLRQRRQLASLGGLLASSEIHICPACFSVL